MFFLLVRCGSGDVGKEKEATITIVGIPIRRRPYQSSTYVVGGGGDADHGADVVGDKCFGLLNY